MLRAFFIFLGEVLSLPGFRVFPVGSGGAVPSQTLRALGAVWRGEAHLNPGVYEVKVISDFSAAHLLRNFRGKCENLHGHNWKIKVVLRDSKLNEAGLLMDFGEIKHATRDLLGEIDHKYLNDLPSFKDQNPSSENIARYLFEQLSVRLNTESRYVFSVSAWESADACATFVRE